MMIPTTTGGAEALGADSGVMATTDRVWLESHDQSRRGISAVDLNLAPVALLWMEVLLTKYLGLRQTIVQDQERAETQTRPVSLVSRRDCLRVIISVQLCSGSSTVFWSQLTLDELR